MGDDDLPTVVSVHIAKATRLPMRSVEGVEAEAGKGLVGDRYHGTRHRHVTVQSAESLLQAAETLGSPIAASLTRRNVTISHGAVPTVPGTSIRIGDVELEVVRIAAPCKLLDDNLGPGAQGALRGRAGAVCRVLASGRIEVGAPVALGP